MSEIVFATNTDDWEGMYINGELVTENHNIDGRDVIEILAKRGLISGSVVEVDMDWLDEIGRLPTSLSEVKLSE